MWVRCCKFFSKYVSHLIDIILKMNIRRRNRAMDSLLKSFEHVLQEYSLIELDLEIKIKEKLDKIQHDFANDNKYDENSDINSSWEKENNAAMDRNKNLLKNLELTKAKLRSLYCYQPASDNLITQIKQYKAYMKKRFSNEQHQKNRMIT